MPDFFKECREKQALKDHYAALRHVTMTTGSASLLSQLEVPDSANDKSTANLSNSDDEAIQTWLTDLLCDETDDGDNETYSDSDGDSLNVANQLVGPGSAGVGHGEMEQDGNDKPSGFPQRGLGLGAVPDLEIADNVDSPDNMDCRLDGRDNDLDLYVSTSMDFEEECIPGINYEQVIISAVKTLAG